MNKKKEFFIGVIIFTAIIFMNLYQVIFCSGDSYYNKANNNYYKGLYSESVNNCKNALRIGLNQVEVYDVYYLLGESYMHLEKYNEAIIIFNMGIEANDDHYKMWNSLGMAYLKNNDHMKAIECYEKSISINEQYATAYCNVGLAYSIQDEPAMAIPYFQRAIELDPSMETARENMVLALEMVGRHVEADQSLVRSKATGYPNEKLVQDKIEDPKSDDNAQAIRDILDSIRTPVPFQSPIK